MLALKQAFAFLVISISIPRCEKANCETLFHESCDWIDVVGVMK
jgi:hypothetical protein